LILQYGESKRKSFLLYFLKECLIEKKYDIERGFSMSILFTPIMIGNIELKNRLVVAPMQQRQGTREAFATDYHVNHYTEIAKGGISLVIIESTSVSEGGRLFSDDIGILTDEHVPPLKYVVDSVHQQNVPIFIQLCHGGRKSSPTNKGRMLAPSAIAFNDEYGLPSEMTKEEIKNVTKQFVQAAKRSVEAGFDGIELHAAHGYLLHQFLSPLSNRRADEYGGTLENRVRILKEIIVAVRDEVGANYPIQIRFSADDYHQDGLRPEEIGESLAFLKPYGINAVHVSSGGLLPIPPANVYPGYQIPYAEKIKQYIDVPIISVGLIHSKALAEDILLTGKADCIAIGRPILEDPAFVSKWAD
jgi:NADPH2 dehydrogenase